MTKGTTEVEHLARLIQNNEPADATVSLQSFRDLYHLLHADSQLIDLRWILVLLGDEAIAQPAGQQAQIISIRDGSRIYCRSDFDFMEPGRDIFAGSTNGRVDYLAFMKPAVGRRGGVLLAISLFANEALLLYAIPTQVQATLAPVLVNALAIFVSIFTLFALTVDPTSDSALLFDGRFHSLVAADRHIAVTGLCGLAFAFGYTALASGLGQLELPTHALARAAVGSIGITITELSFVMIVGYHFRRRQELLERQLARTLLRDLHEQADRSRE